MDQDLSALQGKVDTIHEIAMSTSWSLLLPHVPGRAAPYPRGHVGAKMQWWWRTPCCHGPQDAARLVLVGCVFFFDFGRAPPDFLLSLVPCPLL